MNPYVKKIYCRTSDVYLYVIDALQCMKTIWGDDILNNRELLYTVVSGNADLNIYKEKFKELCDTNASFYNYVLSETLFGNKSVSLLERLFTQVRQKIDSYMSSIEGFTKDNSGKLVMIDKDYMYLTFTKPMSFTFEVSKEY